MATSFIPADANVGNTRTLIYTCPSSTQSVIFSGTVSNVDTTYLTDHAITIEVQKTDNSYIPIANRVPIPFGSSLAFPKLALAAGEKVYLTGDLAAVLVARLSVVEKV